MKINFTKHAAQVMKLRDIDESLVAIVVSDPCSTEERSDGRGIAQKVVKWHNRDMLCRVVYAEDGSGIRIITAYLTSKLSKYK